MVSLQNNVFGGFYEPFCYFGVLKLLTYWPRQLACAMRSLSIVITIVQSFFLSFSLLRFLLLTHFGETPVREICLPQNFGKTRRYMAALPEPQQGTAAG